jgi:hypothetical protein
MVLTWSGPGQEDRAAEYAPDDDIGRRDEGGGYHEALYRVISNKDIPDE